jgi:multidrug efflux pump
LPRCQGSPCSCNQFRILTVEDRVSRTQFQYTLEDANAEELNTFAPRMLGKLRALPELRDVASDQQVLGLQTSLVVDRDTASRFGITPSSIDQTLYDAYGQRQVSTMFTQLNQYHVVLEVKTEFRRNPTDLRDLFIRTGAGNSGSALGLVSGGSTGALSTVPPVPLQPPPTAFLRRRRRRWQRRREGLSAAGLSHPRRSNRNTGQVPLSAFTRVETKTVPITVNHQGAVSPLWTLSFKPRA